MRPSEKCNHVVVDCHTQFRLHQESRSPRDATVIHAYDIQIDADEMAMQKWLVRYVSNKSRCNGRGAWYLHRSFHLQLLATHRERREKFHGHLSSSLPPGSHHAVESYGGCNRLSESRLLRRFDIFPVLPENHKHVGYQRQVLPNATNGSPLLF